MKPEKPKQAPLMTKEEFDKVKAAHHERLKRDPCGNEARRKSLEKLVKVWEDAIVEAETERKKGTK